MTTEGGYAIKLLSVTNDLENSNGWLLLYSSDGFEVWKIGLGDLGGSSEFVSILEKHDLGDSFLQAGDEIYNNFEILSTRDYLS